MAMGMLGYELDMTCFDMIRHVLLCRVVFTSSGI